VLENRRQDLQGVDGKGEKENVVSVYGFKLLLGDVVDSKHDLQAIHGSHLKSEDNDRSAGFSFIPYSFTFCLPCHGADS
jgi:hypothetical protein